MRFQATLSAALCLAAILCAAAQAAGRSAFQQRAEAGFRDWLERQVWPDVQRRGVSRQTFARAFDGVALNWTLPDLDLPGRGSEAPRQPEFSSPGRYFSEDQLAVLARQGRRLLAEWAHTLEAIERRYGVPRRIVVAIWGRESRFGQVRLPHGAVEALATEAFVGRRKAFFYPELLAALQILEEGHIPLADMKSSWAGAMGQPQFLPSKFLRHAVDFDGDGRRDIWTSTPDSLASIANYLSRHGWRPGRGWGFEVRAPAAVSCTREGPDQGLPLGVWERLGLTRMDGAGLARGDRDEIRFLLMPAGRLGPAFIVSENFYVLKQYNESDLYALFISHLADRFAADQPIQGRWTALTGFTRGDVERMQKRLEGEGHDVGGADGLVGFKTRVAIGRWQGGRGLKETCFPDQGLIPLLAPATP